MKNTLIYSLTLLFSFMTVYFLLSFRVLENTPIGKYLYDEKIPIDSISINQNLAPVTLQSGNKYEDFELDEVEGKTISNEDFEKWKGKYFFECIEAQGEGPYRAFIEIEASNPEDVKAYIYCKDIENDKVIEDVSYRLQGKFVSRGNVTDSIFFSPKKLYDGNNPYTNYDFKLYEKNGKYWIKTEMVVPENYEYPKFPITKLD
ncbi:hypothetical protein [Epilithonimonas zeae]|uniref:hypothetical protein n=1 Tax=Epilithonimonas zeae TaxID=1416779 RepID=UPI00200E9F70|nr:hypothetical protein [Epilithonimonas zeae]UQB67916.1 hypothetical protein KI430_12865 [Epilithonimonas zeae]